MGVRRPLRALPLDCFLPLTDSRGPRASPYKSPTKRSRSPSAMLSPAKRRILYQEGCLSPPSSGPKTCADRERTLKGDEHLRGRMMFSTMVDKCMHECHEPPFCDAVADRTRSTPSSSLGNTAPKVQTGSSRQTSRVASVDSDCRAASQRLTAPPLMVPREMPPRPDPQSHHYPGFDIHYDTYIEIPSTSSRFKPDSDMERDKEETKENFYPKKFAKKSTSVPPEVGSTYPLIDAGSNKPKPASYPATPHSRVPLHRATPLSERSMHSKAITPHAFTPGRVPGSKLAMRQALMEEVDDACSDDEEL